MQSFLKIFTGRESPDWALFIPAFLISIAGLITMDSFTGDHHYFVRQSIWILISVSIFFIANVVDWRFLRRTRVLVSLFGVTLFLLLLLFTLGHVAKGAQSWFSFGLFAFQPSDLAKIVTILLLSKYFSRRHIEIANFKHILVSGIYALVVAGLVFLQPDFGGAVIVFAVWFGMVMVSGISKKHLGLVILVSVVTALSLWLFVLHPYQKSRIITFIHPLADIHGAGYNAYQSTIAVGSGQVLGKGIGQGSQSKLKFLPEFQTDFIFAAFAEEWGFIGTLFLLVLCLALVWRIINNATRGPTNFEILFALGVAILFIIHIVIHAGMNMGLLPVTGIVFPFMSYGGSHLVIEWLVLGILSSMRRQSEIAS
ncbi:rod shape-determining protein RodA [Candidatus Parcubacteria bacterium]|nr:rod shape-determining protein RodA [Candidatus Parcubacteria bacterium]